MLICILRFLNAIGMIAATSMTILQLGDTSFAVGLTRVGIIASWGIYFASALVLQVVLERAQSN